MLNHLSAVFAAIMPFSAVAAGQGTEVSLALTSRGAYVIGEPVILAGSLKNVGTDAFREYRADRPRHAEALEIFISEDGVEFAEYRMGIWGTAKVERSLESLHPNEAWTFELRVLYTYKRASRLAFERPGKYFIKVAYPLIRARQRVESNIVAIEINPPRGVDARVWREIRKPEFLYFLQSGHVQDPDRDVVPRAIELLRTIPKSSYDSALGWALLEYYRHETHGGLRGMDAAKRALLEEVRKVLGLPDPAAGPFPEDKRAGWHALNGSEGRGSRSELCLGGCATASESCGETERFGSRCRERGMR